MANDLMRDPKSGHFLSKFESMAKRAQTDSASFGMSPAAKEVFDIETVISDDTAAVQDYMLGLSKMVREYKGPVIDLRSVVPQIQNVITLAKDDPILKASEKKRVEAYGNQLIQFIARKTSVLSRATSSLTNIAKTKASEFRDNLAEHLQENPSILFRGLGKLVARNEEKETARAGLAKEGKEQFAHTLANRVEARHESLGAEEEPSEPSGRKALPRASGGGGSDTELLQQILTVNHDIVAKLEVNNDLLRSSREFSQRQLEAGERAQGESKQVGLSVVKEQGKVEGKGGLFGRLFDNVGSMFKNLLGSFGEGGLLGLVSKTLMPALTKLGEGALVIGAAWAGWKVGDWVSQLLGLGSSSEALAKLLDTKSQTLGSSFDSIANTLSTLATTGKTPAQLETLRAKKDTIDKAINSGMKTDKKYIEGASPADLYIPDGLYEQSVKHNKENAPGAKDITLTPEKPVGTNVSKVPTMQEPSPTKDLSIGEHVERPAPAPVPPMSIANQLDEAGLTKLKKNEGGFVDHAYPDAGSWAIGYGMQYWQGKKVTQLYPGRISQAEADTELQRQLTTDIYPKIKNDIKRPLDQKQFNALVDFAWNNGRGWKNMARHINQGTATPDYFQLSATSQGQTLPVLQKRRAEESAPFAAMMSSPSPGRNAAPVAMLTASNESANRAPVVIATNVQGSGGGQTPMVFPPRIVAENTDETIRAIRGVNTA